MDLLLPMLLFRNSEGGGGLFGGGGMGGGMGGGQDGLLLYLMLSGGMGGGGGGLGGGMGGLGNIILRKHKNITLEIIMSDSEQKTSLEYYATQTYEHDNS
jgi:hypothetical protein